MNAGSVASFRRTVWNHYKKNGRHDLPWRKTHDAYKVLVSEVMLQQTQVERVKAFYKAWFVKFPTVHALARAPLAEVIKSWQGLGYNRRAKMLHLCAKEVVKKYKGKFPKTPDVLEALPGIGPYTARAVCAFAYNQDVVFVETNLRTVITHHFFVKRKKVDDKEILVLLQKVFPHPVRVKNSKSSGSRLASTSNGAKGKSREWYGALMDYGSYLKRSGVKVNMKSKGYTKQSMFRGSAREARGAILRELSKGTATKTRLAGLLGDDRQSQVLTQVIQLEKEGMIKPKRGVYSLP